MPHIFTINISIGARHRVAYVKTKGYIQSAISLECFDWIVFHKNGKVEGSTFKLDINKEQEQEDLPDPFTNLP